MIKSPAVLILSTYLAKPLAIFAVVGMIALTGCKSSEVSSSDFVDDVQPADVLYNQALASMDSGKLSRAQKKLTQLDRQHPYSEYSRKSLIMQTFIAYRRGQYDEATQFGRRYVALYPGHEDAAYAQYLVGMSYYRQIPEITRDQSVTARAYNAMNNLVERYPESEYVEDARTKMREARDQIAGKEMVTGRYYLERREYQAAINRFKAVVKEYPTTRHVEEALARLTEAYYTIGLAQEAQAAAAVLGHNFPDSRWYADALQLLQSGGLEPRQNPGSWLASVDKTLADNS